MDYTEIFSKAIQLKSQYIFSDIKNLINAHNNFYCGDWDDWADIDWYRLTSRSGDYKSYGFLCAEYPIALLSDDCPEELQHLLDEIGILNTKLQEPMCCDEKILKQYVHYRMVFDERFIDNCNYSFDDERFLAVLERLETGHKRYIDSGDFTMDEIR